MGNCCSCCPKKCSKLRAKMCPKKEVHTLPKPPQATEICEDRGTAEIPLSGDVLIVKSVNLCLAQNGDQHHTSQYETMSRAEKPCLVIRRGQKFYLELNLNREYNPDTDGVSLVFTVKDVEKTNYGNGTLYAVPLLPNSEESNTHWSANVEESKDNILKISVKTPAHCIVAEWSVDIDTKLKTDGALSYSLPSSIYIIYNPWCLQDQVYLDKEEQRQEYVMETTGLIWRGSYNRMRPVAWMYAQFDKDVLECAMYLISKVGKVFGSARGDPVITTRALSAATNASDDYGVVAGNWSDDFGNETPPTKWIGSLKIIQKYYKTKKPVKYGQCWVFSGVLATICRALGIPSRVVTNFSSAHDTQNSLTVDYFVDEEGKVMEEMTSDSIWNFHVWVESWMDRPDLGVDYGGWQAIDSTPQELSEHMYRCGPASVAAVKKGEVLKPYDNGFLFSEVNADKVFWRYAGPTQPLKLLRKDVLGIGQFISTKAIGRMEREDITHNYKYPEKTEDERTTMLKALRQAESSFSRYYLNEDFNDIKFDFELKDDIKIGQEFSVAVIMQNRNQNRDYKVNVVLRVDTVMYTGKQLHTIKREVEDIVIKSGTTAEKRIHVTYEDYAKKLSDQSAFNISCLATVVDTNYEYFAQDDFRIRKPDIKIKLLQSEAEELKECTASLTLENPLPVPIRRGEFLVQGPGLDKQISIKVKDTIAVGGSTTVQFSFIPPRTGRKTIAAKFVSKELTDVDGHLAFTVVPNKEYNNGLDTRFADEKL